VSKLCLLKIDEARSFVNNFLEIFRRARQKSPLIKSIQAKYVMLSGTGTGRNSRTGRPIENTFSAIPPYSSLPDSRVHSFYLSLMPSMGKAIAAAKAGKGV
jgi:hypothetical protein